MSDDRIITIDDLQKEGVCVFGARRWFRTHGIDFHEFLERGLPAQTLIDAGDEYGAGIIKRIRGD